MMNKILIGILLALLTANTAHAAPGTNLLTVNPSFEMPGNFGNSHGVAHVVPGWETESFLYRWGVWVQDGDGTEGKRCLVIAGGGRAVTEAPARAAVHPGTVYRLTFDIKKPRDVKPDAFRLTLASIQFFDTQGNLLKNVKSLPLVPIGPATWQPVMISAIAPPVAATAGVQIYADLGWPDPDSRDIWLDNFRLVFVPEVRDTITMRRAPLLLQPGHAADVKVKYTATQPRDIIIQLVNGAKTYGRAMSTVAPGRGTLEWQISVPKTAPQSSAYSWMVRIVPHGGADKPLDARREPGAFVDERMSGSGTVTSDNPDILYAGRWDRTDPKNPVCYWGGSQVVTRFRGTSLKVRIATADGNPFLAVIDGDVEHMVKFVIQGGQATVATDLPDADHTLMLMKNSENDKSATLQGFLLDPDRGLLRPEPLSARRIEFYGDSITSGGAPDPRKPNPDPNNDGDYDGNFDRTYAAFTARELGADWHPISKGGTGVAGSWVFNYTMLDYWDKLDFDGFNPQKARMVDFRQWQPQAVVITIGHNDRFRAPSLEAWVKNYAILVDDLHRVYPQAQIFCSNTPMSGDYAWWGAALRPLLPSRPWLHYQEVDPDQHHGGHPRLVDHEGMALGAAEWNGLADWIGDTMRW